MWRGVTVWPPILSGASMIRAGWLTTGKMVIYPDSRQRRRPRPAARQLGRRARNASPHDRDWNRRGDIDDFIGAFEGLAFRLARRAATDPKRRHDSRISDGRPGSAAVVVARTCDAARRCRASDVSARLERRGAGDSRCARARRRARSHRSPVDALKSLRSGTVTLHRERRAHEPHEPARRDPARSLRAHRATSRSPASTT